MRFSNSFLDEIRERVPISDVIGRRVTWDKRKTQTAKGDYWACCPFHGEKSPSFHCEDRKGRYYCFGCGASGDHLRFMTELDGLSFPEAVERLADEAGVPLPARDAQAEARDKEKASLNDVMDMANQFFQDGLQSSDGAVARAYLRDRGLASSVQQSFGLGYAPGSRNALKEFLAGKGIEKAQIEACGLVVHGEDIAVSYDRFRDRIMFPIADARGRVIAFGGRAISPDVPAKYLNSPETVLFSKGRVLYNHQRARKSIQDKGTVIVAEGYMDVIALAAAGFENAVAPLGTALTENQLALLWRMTPEPILCFDGDSAGMRAAHRAIDLALPELKPGRSVRFALLPEGQDPDDLIKASGADAMQAVLDGARPLADMIWSRETSGSSFDTPERRAELEANLRSLMNGIKDDNVKRHYAQDLRDRLNGFFGHDEPAYNNNKRGGAGNTSYNQKGFGGAFGRVPGRGSSRGRSASRAGVQRRFAVSESLMNSSMIKKTASGPPLRETILLVTIIHHPGLASEYFEAFSSLELHHPILRSVQSGILNVMAEEGLTEDAASSEKMLEGLAKQGLGEVVEALDRQLRNNKIWQAMPDAAVEDARDGWDQAYTLHLRARTLQMELKVAQRALESDNSDENLEKFMRLQSELASTEGTDAIIEGFGVPSGRPGRSF